MTTESSDGPFIQIQAPGVPYSVVRVPIYTDEGGSWAIEAAVGLATATAVALQTAYREAFNPPPRDGEPQWDERDFPAEELPQAPQRPIQAQQRPQQGQGGQRGGQSQYPPLYCPDHGDELRPSVKNKDVEWDERVQAMIPVSWFHSNPDRSTHTVWRSKTRVEPLGNGF